MLIILEKVRDATEDYLIEIKHLNKNQIQSLKAMHLSHSKPDSLVASISEFINRIHEDVGVTRAIKILNLLEKLDKDATIIDNYNQIIAFLTGSTELRYRINVVFAKELNVYQQALNNYQLYSQSVGVTEMTAQSNPLHHFLEQAIRNYEANPYEPKISKTASIANR